MHLNELLYDLCSLCRVTHADDLRSGAVDSWRRVEDVAGDSGSDGGGGVDERAQLLRVLLDRLLSRRRESIRRRHGERVVEAGGETQPHLGQQLGLKRERGSGERESVWCG